MCVICGLRKPRRTCVGVHGEICSICCGTERERSVHCPITCSYLQEAHRHEKVEPVDPASIPNQDIRVSEEFLNLNQALLAFVGSALFEASITGDDVTDLDVRAALDTLIATYRAKNSGLYFDAKSENSFAASIDEHVKKRIQAVQEREREATGGITAIKDSALLAVLVFLQRLEYMENNQRPRSKAFLDFLGRFALAPLPETTVQPDEPRVIL